MIRFGTTALPFLGARDYLHSTDVFRCFAELTATLPPDGRPVRVSSFKFLRETDRNGQAFLFDAAEAPPAEAALPSAVISFADSGGRDRRFVVTDTGPRAEARRPEPGRRYGAPALTGDFTGVVPCDGTGQPSDFFATLVEANKAIHVATLRRRGERVERPFRFVFCENFPYQAIGALPQQFDLRFRHQSVRETSGRQYTLNFVELESLPPPPIRICFAY